APLVGYFVAQAPPAQEMERAPLSASRGGEARADGLAKRTEGTVTRAQTFNLARGQNGQAQNNMEMNELQRNLRQSAGTNNDEITRRFAQAAVKAKGQAPGPPAPVAPAAQAAMKAPKGGAGGFGGPGDGLGGGGFGGMKGGADPASAAGVYFREYAYR